MTRSEFISRNRLEDVLIDCGVKVTGRMAVCPFHGDTNASMSVDLKEGRWFCHACKTGGGVIDFMARRNGQSVIEFLKHNDIHADSQIERPVVPKQSSSIEKVYSYTDERGKEVFQVCRLIPKSFRQRHRDAAGNWVWSMSGVQRVLYRLPEVLKSNQVWIVEGEKDADNLAKLGFCATCNVGGAGKWLDAYTESLAGKDVVLCGDNDETGKNHIDFVFDSITGKVKTARIVELPKTFKDVSDFIAGVKDAKYELERRCSEAQQFINGIRLPLYSIADLEPQYSALVSKKESVSLSFNRWLPTLGSKTRPLQPGEFALLLADTGTGKTALLQNIAWHSRPLPTLMFEMELPSELVFERFMAIMANMPSGDVERAYAETGDRFGGEHLNKVFPNLLICPEGRLTLEKLENYILRSELKLGLKPALVLLDYVQLMNGKGDRYERTSDTAEGLKSIAKATRTIVIAASQVSRPTNESPDIHLHSAKDSGALENSAGLVIGAWRDEQEKSVLWLKILKNTKGTGGVTIKTRFHGQTMRICEETTS